MDHIQWQETEVHNVEVLNETMDLYRYYDATLQAEFSCDCVEDTIKRVILYELNYLHQYDDFKRYMDNNLEMSDKMVTVLVRFLSQQNGTLSQHARKKELKSLTEEEIGEIEDNFKEIFT